MDVSEEFLDYVSQGALSVEVWGHRRSGFNDSSLPGSEEGSDKRPRSFAERSVGINWNMYYICRRIKAEHCGHKRVRTCMHGGIGAQACGS